MGISVNRCNSGAVTHFLLANSISCLLQLAAKLSGSAPKASVLCCYSTLNSIQDFNFKFCHSKTSNSFIVDNGLFKEKLCLAGHG